VPSICSAQRDAVDIFGVAAPMKEKREARQRPLVDIFSVSIDLSTDAAIAV
jgi:hypothetical protein